MNTDEPHITVNGAVLSPGQALTLRVAANTFLLDLQDEARMRALGDIGPLYKERIAEILKLMLPQLPK